jgi:hypothetical protein
MGWKRSGARLGLTGLLAGVSAACLGPPSPEEPSAKAPETARTSEAPPPPPPKPAVVATEISALRAKEHPCVESAADAGAGARAADHKPGTAGAGAIAADHKPSTNGSLPPERIQEVVRERFGVMRLCYEAGMRRNTSLQGRVETKFVIELNGTVTTSALQCTTMPDDVAVDCVVDAFRKLEFPSRKGGTVTVVYPIIFRPSN